MKKINLLTILLSALLVSGSVWGTVRQVASLTELNNAVTASSSGDTIQLSAGWTNSNSITLSKNLTLDLNGQTIVMGSSKSIQSAASGTTMSVDSVIIKNGTVNGAGSIFFLRGMRKMIVENVAINNTLSTGYCINSATVAGTTLVLKGTNTFSTSNTNNKPINIGKATTIENYTNSLPLSDINMGVAFSLNNQVGGVLNITAAPTKKVTLTNNGTVNISAGTFTTSNLAVSGSGIYNISGGTFPYAIWNAMSNIAIASGKVAVGDAKNVTIQDVPGDCVAKINRNGVDIFFANLLHAASGVNAGETITILKDYVEQQNVTFSKACVVDLNGKQIEIYSWYADQSAVDKSSKYFKVNADVEFKNGSLYAEGTTNGTGILYQYGNTTMTLTNVKVHSKHNNGCAIKFETANSQTLVINAGTTIKSDGLTDIMKNSKTGATNNVSATIINNANLKSLDILDYNYDENCTTYLTFNVTNNAQIDKLSGNAYYFNLTNNLGATATLKSKKNTILYHFTLNNAGTLTFSSGFYGSKNTDESFNNTGIIAITGGWYLRSWYTSKDLDTYVDSNIYQKCEDQTVDEENIYRILKSADKRAQVGEKYYASVFEAMSLVPQGHEATTVIEVLKNDTIPGRPSTSLCYYKKIQVNMNGKKLVFSGPAYGLYMGYTSLDFEGIGELVMLGTENYESMFYMIGNYLSEKDIEPMNHLTIGKDIVVNLYGDATKVASDEQYAITMYYFGQQVDIHGTINCVRGIGNWLTKQGKISKSTDYVPIVNIDGQLNAEQTAIFSENNGIFNIFGDAVIRGGLSGIEAYSGEFNVTGGTIESTYSKSEQETKESVHGNTTTVGAGIVLYAKQASDTIVVNLNAAAGKSVLVNGQMPIKVANPFNYASPTMGEQMTINVEMAKLKATNGQSVVAWAACDDAIAVSGGKFSHVPSYVVPGKTVINTPLDDPDHVIYPYMIGVVNTDAIIPTTGRENITWEINTDWQNENVATEHQIPTSQDQVKIADNQVVTVTGKEGGSGLATNGAYAYSIDIADGGELIVKSGARLVVGKGGINESDKTDQSVIVEPGGFLYIEPTADLDDAEGQVQLTPNTFFRTGEWQDWYAKGFQFQAIGNPIDGETTISANPNPSGHMVYFNTFDPTTGWQVSSMAEFKASAFDGFMFWNNASKESPITYTFKGKLFGNKVETLQFDQKGFHFFANSYTAPIDILALLRSISGDDIQRAVYLYEPTEEAFYSVDYATYGKVDALHPKRSYTTIDPMRGFFVWNGSVDAQMMPMDYLSAVWTPAFEGGSSDVAAPARKTGNETNEVRISISDNVVGMSDYVYLMEAEKYSVEKDNGDIVKLMNNKLNIYVQSDLGDLSTMQTNDLDGLYLTFQTNGAVSYTLNFDWVKGDNLYLVDHQTNITTAMTEGAIYNFTAQPNDIITNRFEVVRTITNVITEVETVAAPYGAKGIFTILGQYVGEESNWDRLPKGVYIVNGNKLTK